MTWRQLRSAHDVAVALVALYGDRGASHYDEAVSQTDHAVQAAALAQAAGAPDALVAAALLHDVGHLLEPEEAAPTGARDLHHEAVGARFLSAWFGAEVTDPIRLHVAAKRYLCAVEPGYHQGLSPASAHSLELQGGAMGAPELAEFERLPAHAAAVELRGWDDLAKRTDLAGVPFPEHLDLLERLARPMLLWMSSGSWGGGEVGGDGLVDLAGDGAFDDAHGFLVGLAVAA